MKSLGPNIEPYGKPHEICNKYEWNPLSRILNSFSDILEKCGSNETGQ